MLRANKPNISYTKILRKRMKATITMVDEFQCENCKCFFCISVNHLNFCPECGAKNIKEKGEK